MPGSFNPDHFICPKCGGSRWGSVCDKSGAVLTRRCNGTIFKVESINGSTQLVQKDCDFKWDEKDDWKFLHILVRRVSEDDKISEKILKVFVSNVGTVGE